MSLVTFFPPGLGGKNHTGASGLDSFCTQDCRTDGLDGLGRMIMMSISGHTDIQISPHAISFCEDL